MIYLPDVNIWIALTSDQHIHHPKAKSWVQSLDSDWLAFCRITELGFLRLLTNHHVMGGGVLTPQRAWEVYESLNSDSRIVFAPERQDFSKYWHETGKLISGGPNAWTDAYLAAFAGFEKMTVVTFDRRFKPLQGSSLTVL